MRLKTKLVLAITLLVFLIAGLLSLVYVSQLLHSAVQQSYDTNRLVANQVRFALQKALETGLKDQKVDPNNPTQLRNLAAEAVPHRTQLQANHARANHAKFLRHGGEIERTRGIDHDRAVGGNVVDVPGQGSRSDEDILGLERFDGAAP